MSIIKFEHLTAVIWISFSVSVILVSFGSEFIKGNYEEYFFWFNLGCLIGWQLGMLRLSRNVNHLSGK